MRMLAAASSVLTIALFLAVASSSPDSPVNAAAGLVAFASAVAFWLGLSPPGVVRLLWRRPEQERLRDAIEKLVTLSTSRAEVAGRVLAPMAAIVGARAIVIRDSERSIVGSVNVPADVLDDLAQGRPPRPLDRGELLELGIPGGSLVVWRPPFAPFFGDDEVNLLRTLGALTGIALDRVRLFEREREMRLALERADEVKSNFVALAAHELRTPATTIHGFVRTLTSVGDRIEEARREELQLELERQTLRLTRLVEQLLDLSRLDAEAIEISPRPFAVRERLEELVRAAAGERADTVEIHAPPHLEASADPDAFDRIVSNLLTNALRYGAPPILVGADRTDRHFRVYVEDRGRGVTPEFVPDLFERFARSEGSREKAQGTGLGLAIAQSYARAHGGALVYEPAEPHGARFQLVLPAA
jgi:signal transduction histidine kinase